MDILENGVPTTYTIGLYYIMHMYLPWSQDFSSTHLPNNHDRTSHASDPQWDFCIQTDVQNFEQGRMLPLFVLKKFILILIIIQLIVWSIPISAYIITLKRKYSFQIQENLDIFCFFTYYYSMICFSFCLLRV